MCNMTGLFLDYYYAPIVTTYDIIVVSRESIREEMRSREPRACTGVRSTPS